MKINNPELLSAVLSAKRVLIVTHVRPDGDAIGSSLAMGHALVGSGKAVAVVCDDPVPKKHMALPGADVIVTPDQIAGNQFDLALAIDIADTQRMGTCADLFHAATVTAQMDHHGTNPGYAQINEIDADCGASGVLVARFLYDAEIEIDETIARCLYTAIASDTGNFTYTNTTSEAFKVASKLLKTGFPIADEAQRLFRMRSVPHLKLLTRALNSLHLLAEGRVACLRLTDVDFNICRAGEEHASNIVNYGIDLEGVDIAFLLTEHERGVIQCSLRAREPYDVAQIAAEFGGGGHKLAAGCALYTQMDEAIDTMVRRTVAALAVTSVQDLP